MENKKRLYWNSCSFLDNEGLVSEYSPLSQFFKGYGDTSGLQSYKASTGGSSNEAIFRRTLIDCSKNSFDFAIIAWSHPERYFIVDLTEELDFDKLKKDSDLQYVSTEWNKKPYPYIHGIPHHITQSAELLKLEPKGTDDTIIYTISLHNFFKANNIPHLFLNMGKMDSKVLSARESWLGGINPKNYLSLNDDDSILQKMQFSFVEYFLNLENNSLIKDKEIRKLESMNLLDITKDGKIYTSDDSGHLSNLGYNKLNEIIYNHIKKHLI